MHRVAPRLLAVIPHAQLRIGNDASGYATLVSLIACQTLAGVNGVLSCLMPSSLKASMTPLVMQGGPPMAPDSPQPLAPKGLERQGSESSSVTSIGGMSSARGTQ